MLQFKSREIRDRAPYTLHWADVLFRSRKLRLWFTVRSPTMNRVVLCWFSNDGDNVSDCLPLYVPDLRQTILFMQGDGHLEESGKLSLKRVNGKIVITCRFDDPVSLVIPRAIERDVLSLLCQADRIINTLVKRSVLLPLAHIHNDALAGR